MPHAAKDFSTKIGPETPFKKAGQIWDERIGNARVQAANWRLAAFVSLGATILAIAGLVYQSTKASIRPYIVEVDALGQVQTLGPVSTQAYTPSRAVIEHFLGKFVTDIRSLPTDPIVLRKQWLDAYKFVTKTGANTLNEYARQSDPFKHIGQDVVTVEISSITPISDISYQVQWKETVFDKEGVKTGGARYVGVFSLSFAKPRTEEELRANPIGLYITSLHWGKQV